MTPRQADRIIRAGRPVAVRTMGETFTALFISRDRWNLYTDHGAVFDRGELELVDAPTITITAVRVAGK